MKIKLPLLALRPYQQQVWNRLWQEDIKKAFLVWHRRAGKDIFCLQYMIARALRHPGNYFYILPYQNQIRRALWEGITKDGMKYLSLCPQEVLYKKSEQDMKLILRNPAHPAEAGSIISFLGGEDYDRLVGAGIQGAVISEFALQPPGLYNIALEPMLRETNGWVIFNTTPRGENHAKEMYDFLKNNPKYLTSLLTIEDTGLINPEDLNEERQRGKPEELIQQEYYCSFEGALQGAYYADMLHRYRDQVGHYSYQQGYPVHTCWDLGVSDSMAIWFVQFINNDVYLIDYYENSSYGLGHYADVLKSKPYVYAGHHLPHDGSHRQLTMTERALSIEGQLKSLGLYPVDVMPRTQDVYADICSVREILSRCYFNQATTQDGYSALKHYRREFDEDRQCFRQTPFHDWTSHGADAFRMIPYLLQKYVHKTERKEAKKWNGLF